MYLGLETILVGFTIRFRLHQKRRQKYRWLLSRFLQSGTMHGPEAGQMAGRLGWYCAALFGWCGRAYVVHLIHRSRHRGGLPWLNRQLEQALWWCFDILGRPGHDLTQVVLTTLLDPTPPGLNYTDASSQFGLGGVLYLPATRSAYFFRAGFPQVSLLPTSKLKRRQWVMQFLVPCCSRKGLTEKWPLWTAT